jgi:DNA repair exonuclease SbcCD nuclease subunit
MKLALINDIHIGVRNDSPVFLDAHEKFFTNIFLPRLVLDKIDTVIILGDLFDRRKYCSFNSLYRVKKFLFDKLAEMGVTVHILVGNHDVTYKNTNRVNSPELLLAEYDNVHVYTEPTILDIYEPICLMPWINLENEELSMEFLQEFNGDLVFGHFEINGFEMHHNGGECYDGLEPVNFKRFEHVFSGHFHEPSWKGNIQYLGAPMQFTWADYDCSRGFSIWDFTTREITKVENPDKMFHKLFYDDNTLDQEIDWDALKNRVVRVHVKEKNDQHKFDLFVDKLQRSSPYQLDIVDNTGYTIDDEFDESLVKNEDTMDLVSKYIDSLDIPYDQNKIKDLFRDLYIEALAELD